jgi:hypothetical protein
MMSSEFEAVGFFGVDGHADAVLHRQLCEFEDLRREFGVDAFALGDFVARMQRGELDRDRRRFDHAFERAARAECADRVLVGLVVTLGVGLRERGLAEHVVGIAVVAITLLGGAVERFADAAAHDELVAHDAHRLAHGEADHRLAGAADEALERAGEVAARVFGKIDEAAGEHEAPGRGVDEHRIAAAEVLFPIRFTELVANQLVGGGLVGNAQQRFGDAHEQHAFLAGKIVLAHEGLDGGLLARLCAHAGDEVGGAREYERTFGGR